MYLIIHPGHSCKILIISEMTVLSIFQASNTFLLALDGDVDFTPGAVRLLLDRMRKSEKVGASCGRIHPIGTGSCNNVKYTDTKRFLSGSICKYANTVLRFAMTLIVHGINTTIREGVSLEDLNELSYRLSSCCFQGITIVFS